MEDRQEHLDQRWRALVPAMITECAGGAVYCWSMWSTPMLRNVGVVAASPADWTLGELQPVFSCMALSLGVATATLGPWIDRVGPRTASVAGAAAWTGALVGGGVAVHLESLPLLYAAYGGLGGIAWALLYLPPVSTTMKWFPDRRGLAAGLTLSSFGVGAALAPGFIDTAITFHQHLPTFVGAASAVDLSTLADGSQAVASGEWQGSRAVVATAADLAKSGFASAPAGVYLLGSGSSGLAGGMATVGVGLGALGALGASNMTLPPAQWQPAGFAAGDATADSGATAATATATRQFPLLWTTVFGFATGGLALISSSKLLMTDIFSGALPGVVTPALATGFVAALGTASAVGRFGWAAASDELGRRNTYFAFTAAVPVMALAPTLAHYTVEAAGAAAAEGAAPPVW